MHRQKLELEPGLAENPKRAAGLCKAPASYLSAAVQLEEGLALLEGGLKYGGYNYRVAPVRASDYYDAMKRHLAAWWEGQDLDPDSLVGLHHLTKLRASAHVLRDAMLCDMFIDDRPPARLPPDWMEEMNAKARALIEAREKSGLFPVPRFTEKDYKRAERATTGSDQRRDNTGQRGPVSTGGQASDPADCGSPDCRPTDYSGHEPEYGARNPLKDPGGRTERSTRQPTPTRHRDWD